MSEGAVYRAEVIVLQHVLDLIRQLIEVRFTITLRSGVEYAL